MYPSWKISYAQKHLKHANDLFPGCVSSTDRIRVLCPPPSANPLPAGLTYTQNTSTAHHPSSPRYIPRPWHITALKHMTRIAKSCLYGLRSAVSNIAFTSGPWQILSDAIQSIGNCIRQLLTAARVRAIGLALYSKTRHSNRLHCHHNDDRHHPALVWLVTLIKTVDTTAYLTTAWAVTALRKGLHTEQHTGWPEVLLSTLSFGALKPLRLTCHASIISWLIYNGAQPALKISFTLSNTFVTAFLVLHLIASSMAPEITYTLTVCTWHSLISSKGVNATAAWLLLKFQFSSDPNLPPKTQRKRKQSTNRARARWWSRCRRRSLLHQTQQLTLLWAHIHVCLTVLYKEYHTATTYALLTWTLHTYCRTTVSICSETLPWITPHLWRHPQATFQSTISILQLLYLTWQFVLKDFKSTEWHSRTPQPIGGYATDTSEDSGFDDHRAAAPGTGFYREPQKQHFCQIQTLNALFGKEVIYGCRALQLAIDIDMEEPTRGWGFQFRHNRDDNTEGDFSTVLTNHLLRDLTMPMAFLHRTSSAKIHRGTTKGTILGMIPQITIDSFYNGTKVMPQTKEASATQYASEGVRPMTHGTLLTQCTERNH